jgi:nucleoside 2-deoxyribosyltransferase
MKIYLSGGFYSGWQKMVKMGAPNHEYFNPETNSGQQAISDFVVADLRGIDWCELVFAFKEKASPYHTGLAAELGYAFARGKIIILVDDLDRIDGFLAGLSKRVYHSLDAAIIYLRELK